jgi:hypothetical protein
MRRFDLDAVLAATIASLAVAGCASSTGTPPPSPSSIEPVIADAGSDVPVVIRGSAFHVKATVDVGTTARVDAGYRAWIGGQELADVRWIDVGTLSARVRPGVPPGRHDLAVEGPFGRGALASAFEIRSRPASLAIASLVASPDPVNLGQDVFIEMVVSNSGDVDALGVAPSLAPDPADATSALEGPAPASAAIDPGGTATFAWRWVGAAPGPVRFTGTAAGVDALSVTTVSAPARDSAAIVVQRPAALAGDLVAPARVNFGQLFDVALAVSNLGVAVAAGVAADLSISPTALAAAVPPAPAAVDLPGSSSATLTRRFEAIGVGVGAVQASVSGTDATDLRILTLARSKGITVELAADLSAQLELSPPGPIPPGRFEVRMTVTNRGDAVALGVSPTDPSVLPGSSASASLVSGPVRVSGDGDLSRGEAVTFSWTFATLSNGILGMGGSASALDANDRTICSATAPGVWTEVTQDVRLLFADPFGDGTAFTFLFAHGGRLYLGPDRTGAGAVRSNPDGSAPESVAFGFSRDVVDTDDEKLDVKRVHSNPAPPYLSLGYTGCTCNALAMPPVCDCGPDVENARGLFTSGTAGGKGWLVAAGARTDGNLKYVYLTADEGPALQFSYVDLRALLSGESATLTAASVFGDRVYVGFSESSGSGPLLAALLTLPPTPSTPAQPGIEAVKDIDFLKMGLGSTVLGKPPTKISWVDAMAGFGGRLYVVNDTGCVVSRTGTPAPGDFADCTPSAAAWAARSSRSPPAGKAADIEPADRAIPQLASWSGRLYAIRNTVDVTTGAAGPQLWSCDPTLGATATSCEPGDWTLVAPNPSGDALLTQLGSARNDRAALLAASATALYVGYDNPDGVQLFRTSEPFPTSIWHFRGRDGCIAGTPGCQGLGGNGLGVGARRILDGKALTFGGVDRVYLVAGDGTGPVRVFRIPEGAP